MRSELKQVKFILQPGNLLLWGDGDFSVCVSRVTERLNMSFHILSLLSSTRRNETVSVLNKKNINKD